jgi:hypothetical protein
MHRHIMRDLEKRIVGDWVDIREAYKHQFSIIEYFKLERSEILSIIDKLEFASEQGIVEYKKSCLLGFYRAIEDIRYKSFGIETLTSSKTFVRHLLFATLIQRLIVLGTTPLTSHAGIEEKLSAKDFEITLILRDVLQRIKIDPELKKNMAIKNILVQFAIYRREKETLDKLKNSRKNTSAFYKNFKETFDKVFASIRRHYELFLKEEALHSSRKSILSSVPLTRMAPQLTNQAKLFAKINTTIDFALAEKYKVREILIDILDTRTDHLNAIDNEMKLYKELAKTTGEGDPESLSLSISKNIRTEVVAVLARYLEKETPNAPENKNE